MKTTAPDSLTSTVTFNVISLGFNPGTVECSFFEHRKNGIISAPLQQDEMPADLQSQYDSSLYTDFKIHDHAPETSVISLEQSPAFAVHYLNWRIYQWFKDRARLRRKNFVNQNEFCFLKHRDEKNHIATFDRYTVRAGFGQITDGPELTVTYSGETRIWLKSILKYPGPTKDIRYVAYKGHIYRYKYFFKGRKVDRNKVHPVINRAIATELNLPSHYKRIRNKIKHHTVKIDEFYDAYITDEDFIRQFQPAEEGFLAVSKDDLKRISPDAANLEFGKSVIEKDPHKGMKRGGPYQPPDTSHFKLFFIVSEEDKSIANKLFVHLRDGLENFPGLNTYAQIPVHFDEQHITFTDTDNPYPEVRDKLKEMEPEEDIQYGAIYISPISKFEKDQRKYRVYFKIKEELLKHRITSQCVYRDSVNDRSFQYYLPNISVALLAKLDGIPWTLEQKPKKELVIGVNAYSPNHLRKTYLGSAFCFSNRGEFQGFDSFTEDDNRMLAGSFQKAIKRFSEEHEDIERNRHSLLQENE